MKGLNVNAKEIAENNLIFKCVAGSYAYSTNIPGSDFDTRGVFISNSVSSLGLSQRVEQVETPDKDETIFEFDKFVRLAVGVNPNVIELLYTPEENIIFIDEPFQRLRDNAHLILSTKARFSFSGYAFSQLKKIKSRDKWIGNPQSEEPPTLSQFCTYITPHGNLVRLSNEAFEAMSRDSFLVKTKGEYCFRVYKSTNDFAPGIITEDGTQFRYIDVEEEKLQERVRDRAYFCGTLLGEVEKFHQAHKNWKNYWTWKKNRNPVRAKLEESFGYDGKNAMHLVRLMRMAEEILTTGQVIVKRPDAAELLEIRNGKWTYEELIKWSEEMDKKLDYLYEKSTLRKYPDWKALDELVMDIKISYWKKNDQDFMRLINKESSVA